jgi:metal-responsive CopG/Arc/MetJ family transcriptional regulator
MNPYAQASSRKEKSERVVFMLPKEELEAIDGWGVPAGMRSRAETIRTLLRKGLEAADERHPAQ